MEIDKTSTLQASLEAFGPISGYRSIDFDKLNKFCSICLNKILTSLTSFNESLKRFYICEPLGPWTISLYHSIEQDELSKFCSICNYKMLKTKKILKNSVENFNSLKKRKSFSDSIALWRFLCKSYKNSGCKISTLSL